MGCIDINMSWCDCNVNISGVGTMDLVGVVIENPGKYFGGSIGVRMETLLVVQ